MLPPPLVDLAGLSVPLADDVATSGETLALVATLVRPPRRRAKKPGAVSQAALGGRA